MKIAIPSMDGQSISAHFGRSRYFLVLGIEGGLVRSRELRINVQEQGHEHEAHASGEHHAHDHGAFANLLSDCEAVICGGMGMGARRSLEGAGLRICIVDTTLMPEEAASAYALGNLVEPQGAGCGCRGKH